MLCASGSSQGEIRGFEGVRCAEEGCDAVSVVGIVCEKCGKSFCVTHRHVVCNSEEDLVKKEAEKAKYRLAEEKFAEAKAAVDKTVSVWLCYIASSNFLVIESDVLW